MSSTQPKTILMPIFNGLRARNFFLTDTFDELLKANIRIVILAPSHKIDFYRKHYAHELVVFEDWKMVKEPWQGKKLHKIAFSLLDTGTIRAKQYMFYVRHKNFLKFLLQRMVTVVFGNRRPLRLFVRWLDQFVPLNKEMVAYLNKYKPDLVIAPDIILSTDRITLRAAKRLGYPTLGMVRSWDNLTAKGVIQLIPDHLVSQTSRMKGEAIHYGDMKAENISVVGAPQFDIHFKPTRLTREQFLDSLDIPRDRRLVLCAPFFGEYSTKSGMQIVRDLAQAIDDGKIPKDVHLLVRYRPEDYTDAATVLQHSFEHPHVTITRPASRSFRDAHGKADFEFTIDDLYVMEHSLRYSSLSINTISTFTIDAAAIDCPVINVRYDADPETPPPFRVELFSHYDHYLILEKTGGVRLVYTPDELLRAVNEYLQDPSRDREGRARIRDEQIEFTDGKSGARTAEAIVARLKVVAP